MRRSTVVAALEVDLAAARQTAADAQTALAESLGENTNAQNAVVVSGDRVVLLKGGAATEGLLIAEA